MLNNSNKLGAPNWNSNFRTKFEFKSRKKKKKTEKGNEEEGLAAQAARLHGLASPTAPTLHRRARTQPMSRPSASPTLAHPSASLAATDRWTPHVSHPRLQCRLPHPRLNHLRDRRPTAVAGAGQGVTPREWPCPLGAAPTQPRTAVG